MPHRQIEYGVLYYIAQGPSREAIYDCARLGQQTGLMTQFELRGEHRDFILSRVLITVQGADRVGKSRNMLFFRGQLAMHRDSGGTPLDDIWSKAFYFAEYNHWTLKGRILLAPQSFLESPLKQFGPYKDVEDEL